MKLIIENWRKFLAEQPNIDIPTGPEGESLGGDDYWEIYKKSLRISTQEEIKNLTRLCDEGNDTACNQIKSHKNLAKKQARRRNSKSSDASTEEVLSGLGTAVEVIDAVLTIGALASGVGTLAVAAKEIAKQGLKKTVKTGINKYGKTKYKEKLKNQVDKKKQMDIKFRPPKTKLNPKDVKQQELFKAQQKRLRGEKLSDREQDILDILDWQPRQLSHLEQGVHLGAEFGIKSVDWHARNNPLFKNLYGEKAEKAAREWIKAQIKLRKQFPETFK